MTTAAISVKQHANGRLVYNLLQFTPGRGVGEPQTIHTRQELLQALFLHDDCGRVELAASVEHHAEVGTLLALLGMIGYEVVVTAA